MVRRHLSASRTLLGLACLCATGLVACNKDREPVPRGAPAEGAAKPSDKAAATPGDKAAANQPAAPVLCADFLTKEEVTALGLNAEPYNATEDADIQAARCVFGELSAAIWRGGDKYAGILDGIKKHGKNAGITEVSGPSVGAETFWTTMPGEGTGAKERHTLNFVPPNKKFTASITGTDKPKVEQVGNILLAKFQKL